MKSYEKLLLENKAWAAEQQIADPEFFKRLQDQQAPEFLWIGCSDSRVPPNQITNTQPGEMFIHRNIANLVVNTDLNLLSVLQYAVEVLKVKHVIVCGHYGCGGVKAAMSNKSFGLIDNWLKEIKDVIRMNKEELDEIADDNHKFDRMVEINVREQVLSLAKTTIIQNAWKNGHLPHLHGWVYGLKDGLIKPVCELVA
ncbi:MAG: carbonic anhydrase, partial [Ferruginibacter sp.]